MPNIFDDLPGRLADEAMSDLLTRPGVRIERIVSTGQASPPGFWYEQPHDEWVIVLSGTAVIAVEGEGAIALRPGDHVFLPAGKRHRVVSTDVERPTVWLAVHIGEGTA